MWCYLCDISVILCLRVVERSRVKCGQYWPLEEGRTEQHGYFMIRNTYIQVFQDFKLSHLELYNTQVRLLRDSWLALSWLQDIILFVLSLVKGGTCATTSISAGRTLGSPKVLQPCWISVSMFYRGGRLPSKVSVRVGQDRQGGPRWLCTVVLVLAAQVIPQAVLTSFIRSYKDKL